MGNAACAPCHAAEFRALTGSRHATTLREASPQSLGPTAPPLGPVPLAGYALTEKQGHLALSQQYPQAETQVLDYALGSGKTGMTYLAVVDKDETLEAHMSYFPHEHTWEITPGQEIPHPGDVRFGRFRTGEEARRCIVCHTTTLESGSLSTLPTFYGVGCEACHGPGKAHIEAIQTGKADDHMARLEKLSSSALNDACGKCHRTLQQVDMTSPEANQTHRFQPLGLARSRCRLTGNGPLSCLTCHDPHRDADPNLAHYDRVCLGCHTQNRHPTSAFTGARTASICPVNARDQCTRCHMPPKKAFTISNFPGAMVDHLIAAPKKRLE